MNACGLYGAKWVDFCIFKTLLVYFSHFLYYEVFLVITSGRSNVSSDDEERKGETSRLLGQLVLVCTVGDRNRVVIYGENIS